MAERIRAFDWSKTPLGPMDRWPQSLRTAVSICLGSRFPMMLWWGPELINIYNDAFISVLGEWHPRALGKSGREVWTETWPVIGPQVAKVMEEGGSTLNERVRLVYTRHGFPEETWFTWSFGPIYDESGRVGGLFNTCHEDTQQVLAERERDRLATHRQLALDAARLGWWHYDPATKVATFDQRYTEIFGVTGHQRPNEEILKRLHPGDLPRVWAKVEAALDPADPKPFAAEYRILLDDGSIRWVEAHGSATFEGEGAAQRAVNFVGTVADVTERRLASAATRDAEQRYRAVFESSRDAKIIYTRDGTVVDANPAACAMYGYAHDEIVGVHAPSVIHPNALPAFREFQRAVGSGTEYHCETVDRRRDGSVFPIEVVGTPLTLNGQPHLMSVIRDISERKRAEERLRRSHDTFYNLIQNNPFGVYVVDADFRLREVSLGAQKVFQHVPRPLLGRDFSEVLRSIWAEPFATTAIARFRHTLDTGEPYTAVGTVERRQDVQAVESYDWRIERVTLPDGRFGVVCYFYDLTERQQLEAALGAVEARLRLTADAIPALIAYVDADRRYQFVNAAYRDWFGTAPQEVVGRPVRDVVGESVYQDRLPQIERALAGEALRFEYPMPHATKGQRDTETSYVPDVANDGTVRGFVVLVYDITERREAERERERLLASERAARVEAERASEAKSEFLATLSHELRTPLTPVMLTVSLIESHPALHADLRADVAAIRRNVELESRLISDLLDLTRIERGKLQLDEQYVDLHLIIRSAIDICQREASARLMVELGARCNTVRGDSTRLQQVFWNLINNAIKFTPQDRTITVRSSDAPDARVRVEISDSGVGIDPAVLPKLFTAFEQGDVRAMRQQAGLGLGLAISKRLVEAHGGSITAASEGRGRGASFTVELPVVAVEPTETTTNLPAPLAMSERPLSVLLVEDHEPTLRVMERLLRQIGHRVTGVRSVASATAAAAQDGFDLIISDLGLPDGSGLDVMRQLRDRYTGRAIALTGYGMDSDVAASREAGFAEHLTKPVDLAALEGAIRRVSQQKL
jgi:PAS domain S-box-containing protein